MQREHNNNIRSTTKSMDNKTLNAQESIRIIEQTLQRSAKHLEERSGKALVFWGYLTCLISLLVYLCTPYLGERVHLLWILIPLLGYPLSYILGIKNKQYQRERGFVERFLWSLWLVIGLSNSFVGFYFGFSLSKTFGAYSLPLILGYVCLSCSMAMLITGLALRIKAYQWGAIAGFVYLIISTFGLISLAGYPLSFALLIFCQMCLVGHYLMHKNKQEGRV